MLQKKSWVQNKFFGAFFFFCVCVFFVFPEGGGADLPPFKPCEDKFETRLMLLFFFPADLEGAVVGATFRFSDDDDDDDG